MSALRGKNSNKSGTRSPIVEETMKVFEWAFNKSIDSFNVLDEIQQGYDNEPDTSRWQTVSEMPVPVLFNSVEKTLPQQIDRLFPEKSILRLLPSDDSVSMEQIQNSERFLEHMIRYVMKLKRNSFATIKDCFKLGVGYGIVEPIKTTPFVSRKITVRGGTKVKETRQMKMAKKPVKSLRFRYISSGQVVPTPDGSTPNGPKRCSTTFHLDIYREQEFRDLYSNDPTDGEDKPRMMGNPDDIIEKARNRGFSSEVSVADIVAALGGKDITLTENEPWIPVMVPVLKAYSEKQHLWIAVGEDLIWRDEGSYQTQRCPINKASAWPDSDRWFPTTAPWVTRRLGRGMNFFVNALMDMLAHYFRPPMAYNSNALKDYGPPKGLPGEKIPLLGPAHRMDEVIDYLKSPPIPNQIFTVGELLRQVYGDSMNQPEFLANAQSGVMRGGGFAFGDLNKPITMRDALAASVLESSWLDDIVQQTLIEVQTMAMSGSGELSFVDRAEEYNPESDSHAEQLDKVSITEEDIVRAFSVEIDLGIKHDSSLENSQNRFGEYDRLINNPLTDKYEVTAQFVNDEKKLRRLIPSRKVAREQEEQRRQAELEAIRTGQADANIAAPTGGAAEQAVAGAESSPLAAT